MTSDRMASTSSDADAAPASTSAMILPAGRRGFEARFEQDMLILSTPDISRRIPLTAIERIAAPKTGGRRFTVVLTAPQAACPVS